jgi:hypothetical protein
MALVVFESEESRRLGTGGGSVRGPRVFHVFDDATAISEPSAIAFGTAGLPDIGDLFPGETDVYAVSYEIEVIANSNNVWRVEFTYQSGGGGTPPPEILPTEPGYIQLSMEFGGQFKDFYRSQPSLNLYGGDPNATAECAGTPIDAAGEPLSVLVIQHRLVIEETIAVSDVQAATVRARAAVGTRNESPFFGAASGTLLYEGTTARRVSLTAFSLTHRFLYDQFYHMGQQPKKNSQRQVEVDLSQTYPRATFVRWVQPYPVKTNFNLISENF